MKSIDNINNLNKSDFLTIFGNVFEKTDWIAEKVFGLKPFKDFNDFSTVNDVFKEFFGEKEFPARTTVEVSELPLGALIEIHCIASR